MKLTVKRTEIKIVSPATGRVVTGYEYEYRMNGKVLRAETAYAHEMNMGRHTYPRIIRSFTAGYLGTTAGEARRNAKRILEGA